MKKPTDKPEPTFFGHKMQWVKRAMPHFFGSFWMWKSSDGKVIVRAWPAQHAENDDEGCVGEAEVHLIISGEHEWFHGRYKTHKELLRLLRKAESELRRQYKEIAKEYKILLGVVMG